MNYDTFPSEQFLIKFIQFIYIIRIIYISCNFCISYEKNMTNNLKILFCLVVKLYLYFCTTVNSSKIPIITILDILSVDHTLPIFELKKFCLSNHFSH